MEEYFIALVVGTLIGLIGSGGSIVAIPAFMYLANYSTSKATDAALILVTTSAAIAVAGYSKKGKILYRDSALFALSGILGSFAGTVVNNELSDQILLVIFAAVLSFAAVAMPLSKKLQKNSAESSSDFKRNIPAILFVGVIFGFLTGLIGVGGGFIIIPLLVVLLRYQFSFAVGTSVVIILINALSSIAFRILTSNIEILSLLPLAAIAGIGAMIGMYLNGKLNHEVIQKVFVVVVILIAVFTVGDALI